MKKVVLFISIFAICAFVTAQTVNDSIKLKFGFNLGLNYSLLKTKEPLPENATFSNGSGFRLGIVMENSLTKKLVICSEAELSFNDAKVIFDNSGSSNTVYDVSPSSVNVMTHVAYKIGKEKRHICLLAGPCFKLPLSKGSKSSTNYETMPDLAINFGIGLENKLRYFSFAPELRYSYGLLNVNTHPALQTLNLQSISLIFKFI